LEAAVFIVQESIHADHVSRHATREEAIAAIDSLIRAGAAKPGDLNIREIDETGATVDVFTPTVSAAASVALAADVPLTPREQEVLQLLADGLTYRETARRLFISHATVKVHVRHIRAKLEADARTRSVAPALLETLTA
jgi:DNA-binding NarL/FixJ family response regulator